MAAAWQSGARYLEAGASTTQWISWNETWQGVQFIIAQPTTAQAQIDVTAYGMRSIPRFGQNPLISYWVDLVNRGPSGTNYVLRGQRVAD